MQEKKLSALLRVILSKHDGDFYCLNCFHLFRTKNKLESHKKVCENKEFCNVVYAQYCKSDKAQFIIYADLESLMEKIDGCKNNLEKSSAKVSESIPSCFSMSTISSFKDIETSMMYTEIKIA